ncbi:uncharacterized protein LOC132628400 [Lycium barbarum]|uniref:uncharacterized protein LOC132628400 n=1 Tax=Lycium barbarum TaxID=112863 RepID=UPI00293F1811|nr:uncharacterized protein LOC132628400 [Lycium barbarum]
MHPVIAQGRGGSTIWKKMIEVREQVEHNIWWQLRDGSSSFWFENWTKLGALYYVIPESNMEEEIEVKNFLEAGRWNLEKLSEFLPEDIVLHIQEQIPVPNGDKGNDTPWWQLTTNGSFSVKSAWDFMRQREEKREVFKYIWDKGVPTKINFFMWRVWKGRIAIDDIMKRMQIALPSRCWCCSNPQQETMSHLFLTSPIAEKLWRMFASCAGLIIEGRQLSQVILSWWTTEANPQLQTILRAVPAIIMWEIWKRRNAIKHGANVTFTRLQYQVSHTIHQLCKTRYPWLRNISMDWTALVQYLGNYKPKLFYAKVLWNKPNQGILKCNMDGASRGNPRRSSYAFCMRNHNGDLIYAQAEEIHVTTNMEAEAVAIRQALIYCRTQQIRGIQLETDSKVLQQIIQKQWKPP